MINFLRFGSGDSLDDDIMIVLPELGKSIQENKDLVLSYKPFFNSDANINLCAIENGIVTDVFKGTIDEVNNSIFCTFELHNQNYDVCPVVRLVERDAELKLIRGCRIILSLISHNPEGRKEVKNALKGNIYDKIKCLKDFNFYNLCEDDFSKKNMSMVDAFKTIAFQVIQMEALLYGREVYTKEQAKNRTPKLAVFINRKKADGKMFYWEDRALLEWELNNLMNIIEVKKFHQTKEN